MFKHESISIDNEPSIELPYHAVPLVMTKRTTIVLPDAIYEDLQDWAQEEGRPTANLVAFLVEQAVRLKYPQKYPSAKDKEKKSPS